mgnify:CR=1 FL=1
MIHFSVNFYIQFFGTGDNCKIELILFNRVLRNDMDSGYYKNISPNLKPVPDSAHRDMLG